MKTSQLHTYRDNYKLKEHQKILLKYISNSYGSKFQGNILDIGCATGVLLNAIKKKLKNSVLLGVDTSADLIRKAKSQDILDSNFLKKDFMKLNLKSKFDIVIAAGVLAFYDDFTLPLNKMLSLLKKKGSLYVIGTFNSKNIDTLVKFRNNYTNSNWETGLNSYSIETISKFLKKKRVKYSFKKFQIPINLKQKKNPIISYTLTVNNKQKILLNDANIRMELFYLIIKKVI